jgi:hypothetical protein
MRDYDRFGIDIVKNNGFEVEVWDLTPVIDKEVYKVIKVPDPIDYKHINCKLFLNKGELYREIKKISNDSLVITIFGFDYKTHSLFKELSRSGIPYALFHANTIPLYGNITGYKSDNKNKFILFLNKIKHINLSKLKKYIFNRIPKCLLKIQPPAFILAGGSQTIANYRPPLGKNTKIIWAHTLDYDLYLEDLLKPSINEYKIKKYAVFIDGYWPFYPDYVRMNVKPPVSPENYFPLLCDFFSDIERETGCEIIIAAHPRSNYEEHPDYFEGRKTIRGKTRDLIRDSEFVLMHYSTSLNFAVLYEKPVIFFTTDEMEKFNIDANYIRAYSFELNKSFININLDHKIDWQNELKINKEDYKIYKEKYIKKKNTEEKLFWQIVADEIKDFLM